MVEKQKGKSVFAVIGTVGAVLGIIIGLLSLTVPTYFDVTDGEICGYSERTETSQPHKWNECENPKKVTGYQFSETVSKTSEQVGEGKDQAWHCANIKREKEESVDQSIVWSNQRSSEESEKGGWGRQASYQYHCTIDAKWGPIYEVERWEGCGEAAPVTQVIKEAKTCPDLTRRLGWKWRWNFTKW